MQLVVPSAVKNAVSAATTTFTANSITFCFLILGFLIFASDSHGISRSLFLVPQTAVAVVGKKVVFVVKVVVLK